MLLRANSLHSKHYFECFTYNRLYLSSLYGVGAIVVSFLQLRKLRHRAVTELGFERGRSRSEAVPLAVILSCLLM